MFVVNVFPSFYYYYYFFLALLCHSPRPNEAFDVDSLIDNLQRNIPLKPRVEYANPHFGHPKLCGMENKLRDKSKGGAYLA